MRTSIFFGLIAISSAISEQTGYKMSDDVAVFGAVLLIVFIMLDIKDAFK